MEENSMCKVISVANQKGGVAKSTTTLNLGVGLVKQGKRVLLIDADPQGSLTASLGYVEPDDIGTTLATIMMNIINDEEIGEEEGILHHKEQIDLLPANIELSALEVTMSNVMSRERIMKEYIDTMFVIISDTDDTFNFVVAIMYTQLFNLLCDKADDEHGGRLPYHVRLLLDEFSNIGQIPKFDKLIATIRSREISASIILQSQSQLKTIYKDAAETITGNCDTVLFLGGKESSTLKEISETLGKETIDLYNTSDTRGTSQSYGLNYQKTGKELMSRDELAVMDGNKCILQLRGVRPFLSNKYDITKHKRYKELSDANKRNAFDVEKYLEHKLVFSQDTEFEVYEVNVTEEDVKAVIEEEVN